MEATLPALPAGSGLTSSEASDRRARFGRNELPSGDRRTVLTLVSSLAREPMLLLLLVAIAIYIAFGDLAEAAALGASVLVIVTITLVQEHRSERVLDALRDLASPHARVFRDGAWRDLDARELVPGDLFHAAEGDRVSADALLRSGTPITVDESLLTGESVPVVRKPEHDATSVGRPGEEGASIFAGTLVTSGNAIAEVVRIGPATEVGRIGTALGRIELARAPLQQEVLRIVRRVAMIAVGVCVALVVVDLVSGRGVLQAVLAGITLAMSLLPEELPLVLTIFLTLGAWRIARHRVLARRAAAIETLGAITVLCVDKTGTLTQNRMTIRTVVTGAGREVACQGAELAEEVHEAIEYGLLACPQQSVDPMDRAFAALAEQRLARTEHVHPTWRWIREYPLSPGLLAVTHVWRDDQRMIVATKGAPEAIIDLCHLSTADGAAWRERAERMAREGLRVLGIARASFAGDTMPAHPHDYAFELVGMVGLADPLREDTADTIATCRRAGVRLIMITGDHPATARAVAREAGLASEDVLSGADLEALDDDALATRLAHVEVIARAAPAHKLRIIQALRASGHVVGMTGDGVNDAPALKAADAGIAMGRGTDVAREAAGLVILDDALDSIVAAIGTGRRIYDNLRKVAAYLLAVHIPIAGFALLPPLFGWPLLLDPLHIVLLELVIDPTCSIVFELEPAEPDVMNRRPRGRAEHLFDTRRVAFAIALGVASLLGPLGLVAVLHLGGLESALVRTAGFIALIAADLLLVMVTVSGGQWRDATRNRALRWMVPVVAGVLAMTIAVPPLRGLFGFAPIAMQWIALAVLAGIVPVATAALANPAGRTRPSAAR